MQLGNRLENCRREATFHPSLMALAMTERERILYAILSMDESGAPQHMRGHPDTLRDDAVPWRPPCKSRNNRPRPRTHRNACSTVIRSE